MRLLREISKNHSYSIRKSSENLGYIQKAKEEAGCKVACTLAGCSWDTSFKPNFNLIKLTEKGINALRRS